MPYEFCHNSRDFGLPMRWRYSIISPVFSFKTAARTSLGKHWDMSTQADIEWWRMSQQDSIASCVVLNVVLWVSMAGPVGGSSSCVSCCWVYVVRFARVLLQVFMAMPSSCSVGESWARQRRRAGFCSLLFARLAVRAARRIGRRCGVIALSRGGAGQVERIPCRWLCMCPLWVSLELGKHWLTFFMFTRGQERNLPFLVALSQVGLVGNPAAECR